MNDTDYKFYALTPIDDADITVYESALDFVFKNDNVRNVAVSGSYGSGKSSVIASYKKKHSEKKFLHISLAHFRQADGEDNNCEDHPNAEDGKVFTIETILEGKILNQLIHQIAPEKIPRTNFRVKKEASRRRNIITAVLVTANLFLGLYLFLFTQWTAFAQSFTTECVRSLFSFSTHSESRLIAGIGFLALSGIFAYRIVKLQENRQIIKKADVSGVEIEIFKDSNDSYFDKYLNEVLYLFEKVEADVIVFEDMDRYDSSEIFGRLREINTLVNNSRNVTLRFFYLMRDDIFENKDRAKFFDFIVPIVPVVDGTNSFNKFIECFQKSGLIGNDKFDIDLEFLQGLSLYIDDMRILQNICNEFLVYHGRLFTTEQDPNKMLALIAYKSLFPRDFANLQLGRGFMFEIIGGNGKAHLIASEKERLQKEISSKTTELEGVVNETTHADDLSVVYWNKIADVLRSQSAPHSGNAQSCKRQIESQRNGNNQKRTKNIIAEYDDRLEYSESDEKQRSARIARLEHEIAASKQKLANLVDRRLREVITRSNINELFKSTFKSETGNEDDDFTKLKDSPYFDLLKFLIRERWTDETYSDYMTYFYENSLSRVDKIFLRGVTDKRAKEATYKLDKPEMVVSRLPVAYFEQEETLNFALFDFLLEDFSAGRIYTDKAKRLIRQISDNESYDFILDYVEPKSDISSLVKAFGTEWKSFVSDIFAGLCISEAPTETQRRNYRFIKRYSYTLFRLIGEKTTRTNFIKDESKKSLVGFVSSDAEFLATDEGNYQAVATGLKLCRVLFCSINAETANSELLKLIYINDSYAINYSNIETMVKAFYENPNLDNLHTANYSIVMTEANSSLAKYLSANIDEYMTVILTVCREVITDTQHNVIMLLNNRSIEVEKKVSYISYLQTTIKELSDVDDESLWCELLSNPAAIEYSALNIVMYYLKICNGIFDDVLVKYINSKGAEITFDEDCFESDDERKNFFTAIVKTISLSNPIYKGYLNQFDLNYSDFSIPNLPLDKVAILDELGIIKMSAGSLSFIRENYGNYLYAFIKRHIAEYVQVVSGSEAGIYLREEMLELLNTSIDDLNKIEMISLEPNPVTVLNNTYSDEVCAYILRNNFDENDSDNTLRAYSTFGKKSKVEIVERATSHIKKVLAQVNEVDRALVSDLLASDKVIAENKQSIFKTLSIIASDDEIKQWLPYVDSGEFLALYEDRKRPKFENTVWNKSLLDVFKGRKLIEGYELDEQTEKFSVTRWKKGQAKEKYLD